MHGGVKPDACIARYDNVCLSQIRPGQHRLHFAAGRSACDGQACAVVTCHCSFPLAHWTINPCPPSYLTHSTH